MRVATYNVSFYRNEEGQLLGDLKVGDVRAQRIAEVIQRVRPDVLLVNEFDYKKDGNAVEVFRTDYLGKSQKGMKPIDLQYRFTAPVNTGVPSGLDVDGDGAKDGPNDAFGFGRYPGQYGMAVYSRLPFLEEDVRTFQKLLWRDVPDNHLPTKPGTNEPYYSDEVLEVFRLSSKSHWDVPVEVEIGGEKRTIHFLCSHPTPPVFDGPEDRNGRRNHDEIRLWADYVSPERSGYLVDDRGQRGGLPADASFVILGDLNADPVDGDSAGANIHQLLDHPRVNASFAPASEGAIESAKHHADLNSNHQGDPRFDTADFSGDGHGNLRVDYVLPSRDLRVVGSGVFWPKQGEPGAEAIKGTDHRLVWVDLAFPSGDDEANQSNAE